jgi:hypothetical protein
VGPLRSHAAESKEASSRPELGYTQRRGQPQALLSVRFGQTQGLRTLRGVVLGVPERTPARIRLRHWACGTPEVPSGVRTGVVGAPVATRGLRADGHVVGQVPWTPPHTHAFAKRAQQTWLMCPRVLASPRRQLSNASSDSSAGLRSRPGRPLRSPSRDTWALEAMTPAEGMKPPWRRGRQEHVTARYVLPSTSSIQPSPATV